MEEYLSDVAFECLNKFLVVAPRLRRVIAYLSDLDELLSSSFLQAAESAGVERVELLESNDLTKISFTLSSSNGCKRGVI